MIWKTEYSVRLAIVKDDQINRLLKNNAGNTIQNIAEILDISYEFVRHLKTLRYMICCDVWVPHDLIEKKINGLYFLSVNFLSKTIKITYFFKRTGDAVYLVGLEGHCVLQLFLQNQLLNSDKYCS